jgi:glucose-fructose oxidoreductase
MKPTLTVLVLLAASSSFAAPTPMKVAIIGLAHGHVDGFLQTSALTPAGGILNRPDVQLVGVVDPDRKLFDFYAERFHLNPNLYFGSIQEMANQTHPEAVLVFTATSDHRRVVEQCAALGIHVMMEKPLAFTYADALAIQTAAQRSHIHVLVDFETSWYRSNTQAFNLLRQNALGPIVKGVIRDGHAGPKLINVRSPFLDWLLDPKQNGDGALTDFGCYGPDLMTWVMHGEVPRSVTAVTKHLQPDLYPGMADEAEIILNYNHAIAIVQASWNWPFSLKQMDVYGRTGYAKAIDSDQIEVRKAKEEQGQISKAPALIAPYDDPLHYLAAVLKGEIEEEDSVSSLKTNVTVTEILDAATQSAQTGTTVNLPLPLR